MDTKPDLTMDEAFAADNAMWKTLDDAVDTFGREHDDETYSVEDLADYFISKLSNELKAHLLMQIIGEKLPLISRNREDLIPDPTRIDKHLWLDIAKVLGPDHCQSLYHGAVFATRIA